MTSLLARLEFLTSPTVLWSNAWTLWTASRVRHMLGWLTWIYMGGADSLKKCWWTWVRATNVRYMRCQIYLILYTWLIHAKDRDGVLISCSGSVLLCLKSPCLQSLVTTFTKGILKYIEMQARSAFLYHFRLVPYAFCSSEDHGLREIWGTGQESGGAWRGLTGWVDMSCMITSCFQTGQVLSEVQLLSAALTCPPAWDIMLYHSTTFVCSPDSDSYRGSYFQYGGRATNHFVGLDVAPGCHCRVQWTWCHCWVPLQGAIVVCYSWGTTNFGEWTWCHCWVPLHGAIVVCYGGGEGVVLLQGAIVVCYGLGEGWRPTLGEWTWCHCSVPWWG